MSRGPEKLARAIGRAMRELDMGARVQESRAMALWPVIVGEVTAARTRPLHVNRGTLVVAVASSAWATQLSLLKSRYLEAFAREVGPNVVRNLRWRVADVATGAVSEAVEGGGSVKLAFAPVRPKPPPPPPLSEAEQQAIAKQVATIPDPQLARRLEAILTGQAQRRARLGKEGWVPCQRCGVLHDATERPYMRTQAGIPASESGQSQPAPDGAPAAHDPMARTRMCPPCRLQVGQLLDG
jgi:hypothetical protein